MKLKDYIKHLQEIAKTHPNATVICSHDEEGNSYGEVVFYPTLGHFIKGSGEFEPLDLGEFGKSDAVCIN